MFSPSQCHTTVNGSFQAPKIGVCSSGMPKPLLRNACFKDTRIQVWSHLLTVPYLPCLMPFSLVISIDLSPSGNTLATGSGDWQARICMSPFLMSYLSGRQRKKSLINDVRTPYRELHHWASTPVILGLLFFPRLYRITHSSSRSRCHLPNLRIACPPVIHCVQPNDFFS